jgi:hypothetical protein
MPEDEYTTYAGGVARLLREQNDVDDIAAFLGSARGLMGLQRDEADDQADRQIARSLHAWYADQMRRSA